MPGAVQTLQAVLDAEPACACVAPISNSGWQDWANLERYLGRGGMQALARREEYADKSAWLATAYGDQSVETIMVAFFFAMIPRRFLDAIGLLDEGYGMGFGEDDDWCERARRAAFEVRLALGAFVIHDHRATWEAFMAPDELAALQERSAVRLEKRRGEGFA
jgi:GT2 family glycosyltransferase